MMDDCEISEFTSSPSVEKTWPALGDAGQGHALTRRKSAARFGGALIRIFAAGCARCDNECGCRDRQGSRGGVHRFLVDDAGRRGSKGGAERERATRRARRGEFARRVG